MKFGIFYEHQIGRPWDDGTEHQLIQDALDQVEFADSLGIQYVWEVEHHFLEEYSHSSAPEVFLAACSQRTKNMRLGHGIILTAPQFNHPARTAERVSMLDLVSGGRVEFGSGESSSEAELAGFGVNPLEKREQWLEGLEVAVRCMAETPFTGVDGKYVQMPPRNVIPKPVQKPHPPLWVACSRRETILLAAEKGMGALTLRVHRPRGSRQLGDRVRADVHREVPPRRLQRQPTGGVREPDDDAPRRGRGHPPRHRGRQLLRLFARPFLRVRRASARQDRRVGAVRRAPRRSGLRPRGDRRRATCRTRRDSSASMRSAPSRPRATPPA